MSTQLHGFYRSETANEHKATNNKIVLLRVLTLTVVVYVLLLGIVLVGSNN